MGDKAMSAQLEGPFTVRFNRGRWWMFESSHYELVDMNGLVIGMFHTFQLSSANAACEGYNNWWHKQPVSKPKESWEE
jgi:hypothetical protein